MKQSIEQQVEDTEMRIFRLYQAFKRGVNKITNQVKVDARMILQEDLASIGQIREMKQSRKAKKVYNAMEKYRKSINGINLRNTEVKTNMYLLFQKAVLKLLRIKAKI